MIIFKRNLPTFSPLFHSIHFHSLSPSIGNRNDDHHFDDVYTSLKLTLIFNTWKRFSVPSFIYRHICSLSFEKASEDGNKFTFQWNFRKLGRNERERRSHLLENVIPPSSFFSFFEGKSFGNLPAIILNEIWFFIICFRLFRLLQPNNDSTGIFAFYITATENGRRGTKSFKNQKRMNRGH